MNISTLIDLTDRKFVIAANRAALDFIAATNPFAHSDVGSKLIALSKALPDAAFYSPSFGSYAYVALHDKSNRIFSLATGMRDIHFRLLPLDVPTALSAGATRSGIGAEWISVDAFVPNADWDSRLHSWCASASRSFG